jgi:uncharacterized protein (TIGR02453 family)
MPLSRALLAFLRDLRVNNSREWFAENKAMYEKEKKGFDAWTSELITEFADFENMDGVLLKHCSYRIYRDVRFSKNKEPYKTWFSASFSEGGRRSGLMDYYVHIEPNGASFLGGGMYSPSPEQLAAYRQEIDYNAAGLRKIIKDPDFVAAFGEEVGESLVRIPKGFDPDHADAELLKKKQLFFWKKYTDEDVCNPMFTKQLISDAKVLKPYLDFMNTVFFEKESFIKE